MSKTEYFRTTVMLPEAIKREMLAAVVHGGYGLRGKSRWVSEAIESLLSMPNYADYVLIGDEMTNLTAAEVIQIPISIRKALDIAVIEVRKALPTIDAAQSSIIRTSIVQRLLRE